MRFSFPAHCPKCGKIAQLVGRVSDYRADLVCGNCGHSVPGGLLPSDFDIGDMMCGRGFYELEHNGDNDMAIVFGAMAVECRASRLYARWRELDELTAHREPSPAEAIEAELRGFGSIDQKLATVSTFLTGVHLSEFLAQQKDLLDALNGRFPGVDAARFETEIQERLFWKRNRVLHIGEHEHAEAQAKDCLDLARLVLQLFKRADSRRIATHDAAHGK